MNLKKLITGPIDLKAMREREVAEYRNEREAMGSAFGSGRFFRHAAERAHEGGPKGFTELEMVRELAALEQRIEDLERA